jgi:haloalkane dehalogenase
VLVPERPRTTWFHRFSRIPLVSDFVFRALGFPQNILHRVQADPSSIRGDVAVAYRWPLRRWTDRIAPLALGRMVPNRPGHPTVAALKAGETWIRSFEGPLELVWGVNDPIIGRSLRRHERALPQATITRTPAGHFLQEEVPDEIAQAIRRAAERS